jgi:hypothetical protein
MLRRRKSNRKNSGKARPTQSRRFSLEALEPRMMLSTVTWTGGGGSDHAWSNAANWGGMLPSAADDVVIGSGATVGITSNVTVHSLANSGTINAQDTKPHDDVELVGNITNLGTINANLGSFSINPHGEHNGLTFTNSGTVSIASGASFDIGATFNPDHGAIQGRGDLILEYATATFDADWSPTTTVMVLGSTITVNGTLTNTAQLALADSTINANVVDQGGLAALSVTIGTDSLPMESTINGQLTVASGSQLILGGDQSFYDGLTQAANVDSPHTVVVKGGSLSVSNGLTNNGTITLGSQYQTNLRVNSGTLLNTAGGEIICAHWSGAFTYPVFLVGNIDNQGTITGDRNYFCINQEYISSDSDAKAPTGHSFKNTGQIHLDDGCNLGISGIASPNDLGYFSGNGMLGVCFADWHITSDWTVPTANNIVFGFNNSAITVDGTLTNPTGGSLALAFTTINAAVVNQGQLCGAMDSAINGQLTLPMGSTLSVGFGAVPFISELSYPMAMQLTVSQGFTNHGNLDLYNVSLGSTLNVSNGTLVNAADGTIRSLLGLYDAGNSSCLNANTDNQGTIEVNGCDLAINSGSGYASNTLVNEDNASIKVDSGRKLTIGGSTTTSQDNASIKLSNAVLDLAAGTARFDGSSYLNADAASTVHVRGSLLGNTTNVAGFDQPGTIIFDGHGTAAAPQKLELIEQDQGNVAAGYAATLAYGAVQLGSGTYVKLVDESDNASGTGAEAGYAASITVPTDSTFDKNGLHFYTGDTHPPIATVKLNTASPATNDALTATATKSDADGDPVTLTFVWKVNGVVKQTVTSSTSLTDTFDLSVAGNGNHGDTISVEVTPTDGTLTGDKATATATVGYSAPSIAIVTPSGVQSGSIPISYTLTDPDADSDSIWHPQYSTDGGGTWHDATAGSGGDGTTGLASSPSGTSHKFVWASTTDLPNVSSTNVLFQMTPYKAVVLPGGTSTFLDGATSVTGVFSVNNVGSGTIHWTGAGDSKSWTDTNNWAEHVVPMSGNDVQIDVAGTPTIRITSGNQSIHNLTCAEALVIDGGNLTVSGTATLYSSLSLGNGTIFGGTWSVAGGITPTNSAATLDGVTFSGSLNLASGQTITLKNNTTFSGGLTLASGSTLVVGSGEHLTVSGVTSLSGVTIKAQDGGIVTFSDVTTLANVNLYASSGGQILFPAATSYKGNDYANTTIKATDMGSKIDLSHLATLVGGGSNNLSGVATSYYNTYISALSGGEVDLSGAISNRTYLTVDGAASVLNVQGVTAIDNANVTANASAVVNFSGVTNLPSVTMTASQGGQILFPAATSYKGNDYANTTIKATDAGSKIDLSHLVSFVGGGSHSDTYTTYKYTTYVTVIDGGTITLAGAFSGNNTWTLDSVGTFGLDNVTSVAQTSLIVKNGAAWILPAGWNPQWGSGNTLSTPTNDTISSFVNKAMLNVSGVTLTINANFQTDDSGVIAGETSGKITIGGNLLGNTTNAAHFAPQSQIIFNGGGTSDNPQQWEVMGQDLGAITAGFSSNFAYQSVTITNGTRVQLVNQSDNASNATTTKEAIYVDTIALDSGTVLDLNGYHLYARTRKGTGTVNGGAIEIVPPDDNHAPTIKTAASATPSPVTGKTTILSVLGDDVDTGESTLKYTWAVTTLPDGAIAPTFSANGTNAAKNITATFSKAGVYVFQVTITDAGSLATTSSVSVAVNQTLTTITVGPASVTLSENQTQQFAATGKDQFGTALATQPVFAWAKSSGVGLVSADGLYTAPAATGSASVTASSGSVTGSATVTISNTVPTVVTLATATPSPVGGTATALSVLGADDGGESNLTYTWSTTGTPPAAVNFSANGTNGAKSTTATFSKAGVYTFTVTITDAGGLTATSSVNVTVAQTLASITIAPASVTLNENQTQQFTATGKDQFGVVLSSQPSFTWAKASGVGSISANGLYTAPAAAGSANVTATNGSVVGSAAITVSNAVPTVATAAAATPSPANGTTTVLSVLGADDGGEPNLTYTWSTTGTPPAAVNFSVNSTNAGKNTTVTFIKAGSYTFTVTVTDAGGLTATSSVNLTVNQTFTAITVSPSTASLNAGGTQQFTATGTDQFGVFLATQPTFTWGTTAGTISAGGLLTAPSMSVSNGTVTASSGTVSGTATFAVSAVQVRGTWQDTIGLFAPTPSAFFLRNTNDSGYADMTFGYGPANGGWIPVAGDWNKDGTGSIGLYNPTTSQFYLRNTNDAGYANTAFPYGPANAGWLPIAGDWDGDGQDTIGLYNPTTSVFYLRNTNDAGYANTAFPYGPANAGWLPIAGDWNNDGKDSVGLYNPTTSVFYLRNTNDSGYADVAFAYGWANAGWKPVSGDWNTDGTDTIGLYNPTTSVFYLRNTNDSGYADQAFAYGPANAGWTPVVSDWNGSSGSPLRAAGGAVVAAPGTTQLTESALQPLVTEAIARWASAGLNAANLAKLTQVQFAVSDLPGSYLGEAEGNLIHIDSNAAGHGWFVDPTPTLNEEFTPSPSNQQLRAIDPRALDRIDLLTVVEHELGHVLGLEDLGAVSDDLMSGVLGVGIRRKASVTDAVLALP